MNSKDYKTDDIVIPKLSYAGKSAEEKVWYTIGVLGVTSSCEYTLTAISNDLKIVGYKFGTIINSTVSKTSPLVLKFAPGQLLEDSKIFYYSFDSAITAMYSVENERGILKSIPNAEGNGALASESNELYGTPKALSIHSADQKFAPHITKLVTFYPGTNDTGLVYAFLYNRNVPIKIKPNQSPLRVILDKGEAIMVQISANSGELDMITFSIMGNPKAYDLSYEKA